MRQNKVASLVLILVHLKTIGHLNLNFLILYRYSESFNFYIGLDKQNF